MAAAVLLAVAFAVAASAADLRPAINHDIIAHVNSLDTTWQAHENSHFAGWTIDDVQKILRGKQHGLLPGVSPRAGIPDDVPAEFDGRLEWPQGCVGYVRDQGRCGSCWIFGAVEAFSDRICIATNGSKLVNISAYDELTCNGGGGCEGGFAEEAYKYAQKQGVVDEACAPYLCPNNQANGHCILTCTIAQQPCLNFVSTPSCKKECQNGQTWESSKHFVEKYSDLNPNDIEKEIMANGPVSAAFTVYEDFLSYKSGVYKHTTGQALGGHVVKIIGFGTASDNTPYWLVQNSWTTSWGDNGFFMIARGTDECGIEDDVSAAIPKL